MTRSALSGAACRGRGAFKGAVIASSAWPRATVGFGAVAAGVGLSTWAVVYCEAPNAGAAVKEDDDALVDISQLQQFDRNWDGR